MATGEMPRSEAECQQRALAYLARMMGMMPSNVCWDERHHLQGHIHVGNRELVIIATRDDVHEPVVLTPEDWDEVRHAPGQKAADLVRAKAIHDDRCLTRV